MANIDPIAMDPPRRLHHLLQLLDHDLPPLQAQIHVEKSVE
jgi:hypothetical protein